MSKQGLEGKVIIVGGGAKNLGGLISRTFAAEGAKICVHYNSAATKADADKTVADIVAADGEAFAVQGDFTKAAAVTAAFAAARQRFGGIDIAVNTVGKVLRKPIVETTEAEFDNMMAVNAIGPGPMDTPFFYGEETPERVGWLKSQSMNGELTKIEDIVPIVRFLATEGWWINGQTIFANGGFTTR